MFRVRSRVQSRSGESDAGLTENAACTRLLAAFACSLSHSPFGKANSTALCVGAYYVKHSAHRCAHIRPAYTLSRLSARSPWQLRHASRSPSKANELERVSKLLFSFLITDISEAIRVSMSDSVGLHELMLCTLEQAEIWESAAH